MVNGWQKGSDSRPTLLLLTKAGQICFQCTAATDPTSAGCAPRTLALVWRLEKEKPLMEMLINGRTVMIRDTIFHNHATGKPVFFLYKLKSVVYNTLPPVNFR